jgi:hypothetical protein
MTQAGSVVQKELSTSHKGHREEEGSRLDMVSDWEVEDGR